MYKFVYLAICFALFRASNAGMPQDLKKILGDEQPETYLTDVVEDQESYPRAFEGSDFDLSKYIAQSPSNLASIEKARKNLGSGDIEMYMPAKITAVECHVEFQVTERVPGRCTRLAGSIPACQAERYVGINYSECS